MIKFYKTRDDSSIEFLEKAEPGCWILVEQPDDAEINYLINDLDINRSFITSSLDENERSHIESDEQQRLVILDIPVAEESDQVNTPPYYTLPVGFILTEDYTITITDTLSPIFNEAVEGKIKNLDTNNNVDLMFNLIYNIASHFIIHLRHIEHMATQTEKALHKSTKNQELLKLLSLEKSLVYFSTSLKATEITLERISKGKFITLNEQSADLLDDVNIEIKQSIDTATIYLNIIDSIMDTTESIISNNLNLVMKVLTSVTFLLNIPDLIFGFYGMNVPLPFAKQISFMSPILLSITLCLLVGYFLYRKGFFDQ